MRPGQLFMDPKRMIEARDENTIGVVPTFGVTYTGNYEFPQPPNDALINVPTPVSTSTCTSTPKPAVASAPAIRPGYRLGLPSPRVKSISASSHKFGLAAGLRLVIWRRRSAAAGTGVQR